MYITKMLILVLATAFTGTYIINTSKPVHELPQKNIGQHQIKHKKEDSFDSVCVKNEVLEALQDSLSEQVGNISQYQKKYDDSRSALIQIKKDLTDISNVNQKKIIDSSISYSFLDALIQEQDNERNRIQTKLDSVSRKRKEYNEKIYLPKLKKAKGAFKIQDKKNQSYRVFIVDTGTNMVSMYWKNEKGIIYNSLGAVVQEFNKNKILMATNGGMFMQGETPKGLYIENGKEIQKLDTTSPSNNTQTVNFYLLPNGVFYITAKGQMHIDSTNAFKNKVNIKSVRYATQSGPMLITNGKMNQHFKKGSKNVNIRSGVGLTADNRVVFIISDNQVNFYDFAALFKYSFGCKNALYLDGAISKMYLPDLSPRELGGNFGVIITASKR